jgi:hypothetical protein
VDAVEFKLHPFKAEQLNADAERIIFNKNWNILSLFI